MRQGTLETSHIFDSFPKEKPASSGLFTGAPLNEKPRREGRGQVGCVVLGLVVVGGRLYRLFRGGLVVKTGQDWRATGTARAALTR